MRAAALGFLVLFALSGCDQLGIGQHTAGTAAPPCHCVTAAPVEHLARLTPPVAHRHYVHSSHSYSQSWADQYAGQDASSAASESRDYSEDESDEATAGQREVWTDGYGREHHADAHVTRVAADTPERRDPWHAYKSKCGEHDEK